MPISCMEGLASKGVKVRDASELPLEDGVCGL